MAEQFSLTSLPQSVFFKTNYLIIFIPLPVLDDISSQSSGMESSLHSCYQMKQHICYFFSGTVISPKPFIDRTDETVCKKVQNVFLIRRAGRAILFDGSFCCFCDGFGHLSGEIGITVRGEQKQTELPMALVVFHVFRQFFPELFVLFL